MRHQPHLYVPGPWHEDDLDVGEASARHVSRVLRYSAGLPVTYTDGCGRVGTGSWTGSRIERGGERSISRDGRVVDVIVAPPNAKERQRFLVEKCQELGVRRLAWLGSRWANVRIPSATKAAAWSVGALEQSRGAWLMAIEGTVDVRSLDAGLVADASGTPVGEIVLTPGPVTIVVGPEGGFSPDEVDESVERVSFSDTVLRIETAAAVGAAILRIT
jgi:16S rRNA (uracil1498-N3)-methyltransferase